MTPAFWQTVEKFFNSPKLKFGCSAASLIDRKSENASRAIERKAILVFISLSFIIERQSDGAPTSGSQR
jgi:hypothetical protein